MKLIFLSGTIATALQAFVISPMELVRIRMQVNCFFKLQIILIFNMSLKTFFYKNKY